MQTIRKEVWYREVRCPKCGRTSIVTERCDEGHELVRMQPTGRAGTFDPLKGRIVKRKITPNMEVK